MDDASFKNRICIVTGGAAGIGLAMAEELLNRGALVHAADCDREALAEAGRRLAAHGSHARTEILDVTQPGAVHALVDAVVARHGRLDMIFNNAGVGGTQPIETATLAHWRRIVDLNLWGVIYGVDAALPVMRRQGFGHIVNTASFAGLVPLPFQALYCTTKFAVVGLSESLRLELADEGVAVSVVCPGAVVSRIWGTPILGERSDVAAPADAIPAEEAARIALDGVARRDGVIVLPDAIRAEWETYGRSPEDAEPALRALARQRRATYRAKGYVAQP